VLYYHLDDLFPGDVCVRLLGVAGVEHGVYVEALMAYAVLVCVSGQRCSTA